MNALLKRLAPACVGSGLLFAIVLHGSEGVSVAIDPSNGEILVSVETEQEVAYELFRSSDLREWAKVGFPCRGDDTEHVLLRSSVLRATFFQVRTYSIYAPVTMPAFLPLVLNSSIAAEGGTSQTTWIDENTLDWVITVDDYDVDGRIAMHMTLHYSISDDNLNQATADLEIDTYVLSLISSGSVLFNGSPERFADLVEEPVPTRGIFEFLYTSVDGGTQLGKLVYTDGSHEIIVDSFEPL